LALAPFRVREVEEGQLNGAIEAEGLYDVVDTDVRVYYFVFRLTTVVSLAIVR
jgi:hypothetical protein